MNNKNGRRIFLRPFLLYEFQNSQGRHFERAGRCQHNKLTAAQREISQHSANCIQLALMSGDFSLRRMRL